MAHSTKYLASISQKDAERFLSKRKESDAAHCWVWRGTSTGKPGMLYGKFKVGGITYTATHIALHLAVRPRRDREIACHKCDNTLCVNPNHLYWGSHADNQFDCSVRCRKQDVSGRRNGHFRLTPELREIIAQSEETNRALGKRYNVSHTTIFRIKHGLIGW